MNATQTQNLFDDTRDAIAPKPNHWSAEVTVYGEAHSQGSKRAFKLPNSEKIVQVEASKKLRPWQQEVKGEMARAKPPQLLDCAMRVSIIVYLPRPTAHYRTGARAGELKESAPLYPKSGKDLDKIARAIGDCGTGIIWTNDARICDLRIRRRYDEGAGERVVISMNQIE